MQKYIKIIAFAIWKRTLILTVFFSKMSTYLKNLVSLFKKMLLTFEALQDWKPKPEHYLYTYRKSKYVYGYLCIM